MITVRDAPSVGPMIEVVAARIGADGECFVDMRAEPGPDGYTYAGAELLQPLAGPPLSDDAPPEAVLSEMVTAIKTADRDRFDRLFATWQSWSVEGQAYYDAAYVPWPSSLNDAWQRSRAMIIDAVVDVRIARVGAVRRIIEADAGTHRPSIDQVVCTIDHIGRFDDEFRTFMTSFVHRRWVLQRRNEGPWRIIDVQSL
jgi:hypothetical protein